jgi:multiple sugar transport system ATP-binding protein
VAAIALVQVSKTYPNGHAAARDLTLDVRDGELLVLVGPSGSGKSTILRLIAGLETPTSGQILIDGRDVTGVPPQQRDLAMVFQSYALYPHKTVRENLAFALRLRHVAAASIEARVRETAAMLGIDGLLDRKPAQLSGGQRQRVALGRAMVREPKAFLLDEPLSNLDPVLRAATRAELALLHRRLGASMVYVTHDQEEAMTLGTRIAVLRDGLLEQVAPAVDLFQRPANAFVAGFVGAPAMNLWPCVYRVNGGRTVLVSPAGALELEAGYLDAEDGTELLVGVRPHDIELVSNGGGDALGRVAVIEPLGAATVIHLDVGSASPQLVRVVVADAVTLTFGDLVAFRLRRDRLHVFDARTGGRVSR